MIRPTEAEESQMLRGCGNIMLPSLTNHRPQSVLGWHGQEQAELAQEQM